MKRKTLLLLLFAPFFVNAQYANFIKEVNDDIKLMKVLGYTVVITDWENGIQTLEEEDFEDIEENGIELRSWAYPPGFKYTLKFYDTCDNSTDLWIRPVYENDFKPSKIFIIPLEKKIYESFEFDVSSRPKSNSMLKWVEFKYYIKVSSFKSDCKYLIVPYRVKSS